MRSLRLAAGVIALAICGCSSLFCGDDVGCSDSVAVAIPRAIPDGRVIVETKLDGVEVRNDCTVAQGSSTCTSTSADVVLVSRSATGMVVVTVLGAPKHVDVTVSHEGTVVATASFDPVYEKSQPNGESCPPTCRNATHTATLQ